MKNPMLPVIFVIGLIFFLGTIFLYNSEQTQGMVLGESEYNSDIFLDVEILKIKDFENSSEIIDLDYYQFPENQKKEDMKFPIIPQKENDSEKEPELLCSGVVVDVLSGSVLFKKDAEKKVSIASITKLANALVFLDQEPKWDDFYKIKSSDIIKGGRIYLGVGEEVKLKDLFYLALVGSANSAAKALAGAVGFSEKEYVEKMNSKMKELGFVNTSFVDPIGISRFNVSTATEVARLANLALSKKEISEAVSNRVYKFQTKKERIVSVYNTNILLKMNKEDIKMLGGKTGYIDAAGYCFVGKFVNEQGIELISVVLGAPGIDSRFSENKKITKWAYDNYVW